MCYASAGVEHRSESLQAKVFRRQSLGDEEAFDSRRIPDHRQPIAVTDQLNFAIHLRLQTCGVKVGPSVMGLPTHRESSERRIRMGHNRRTAASMVNDTTCLLHWPVAERRPGVLRAKDHGPGTCQLVDRWHVALWTSAGKVPRLSSKSLLLIV
jgi:hypothetical protein